MRIAKIPWRAGTREWIDLLLYDMLAAVETGLPVGIAELIDAHTLARRGMDETPVAQVDAAVGCTGFIGREEYEIAGHELPDAGRALPELVLLIRCAWQRQAVPGKNILQLPGAVKGLWRRSTEFIGDADVLLGGR